MRLPVSYKEVTVSEYKKATFAPFDKEARKENIKKANKAQNHYNCEPYDVRRSKAFAKASNHGRCWWVLQYLRGAYYDK